MVSQAKTLRHLIPELLFDKKRKRGWLAKYFNLKLHHGSLCEVKTFKKVCRNARRGLLCTLVLATTAQAVNENSSKAGNASPPSLSLSSGLNVEYLSLEASGFPQIISRVFVRNASTNGFELGLTESNFEVYEDSVRQSPILVEELTENLGSLSVAILLDRSGSIRDELADAKNAASTFVNLLGDSSRAAILSFGTDVIIEQNFTQDKDSLLNAIDGINSGGRTALYDAVNQALDLLQNASGQTAIITLSDGRDRSSAATLEETLARLANESTRVYSIGLGLTGGEGVDELQAMANNSGGVYLDSPTTAELEEAFRTLFSLLTDHQGYRISYQSSRCVKDGSLRNVQVVALRDANSGTGEQTYLAPGAAVDLQVVADSLPNPGREFKIRIETPENGADIFAVTQLKFTLTFDTTFLSVKTPYADHIQRGALLQTSPSDAFDVVVDETLGQIRFSYQRTDPGVPLTGKGGIAEVVFETDGNTPDSTALPFAIIDLSTDDGSGCEVAITPKDLVTHSYGLIVWPGDTNANGTVELTDVLQLGVYWELNGPERSNDQDRIAWQPQLAGPFSVREATHADADGAGDITERDIIPIGLNWGKTQSGSTAKTSAPLSAAPDGGIDFAVSPTSQANQYRLFVSFSPNSQTALAGVAFRANYPGDRFNILSVELGDAWLDQPLSFSKIEELEQRIAVGVIVPAGGEMPVSGGELVEIIFEASGGTPDITDFSFENFGLVGANGEVTEKSIITAVNDEDFGTAPTDFLLSPAYPNPFNPSTALRYNLPEASDVRIRVFSVAGQIIFEEFHDNRSAGAYTFTWNATNNFGKRVSSGVYLVSLQASGRQAIHRSSRKIILAK